MGVLVDIVLLVLLVFFIFSGFQRGFVRSFVELVGCWASIVIAVLISPRVAILIQPYLKKWVPSLPWNGVTGRVAAAVLLFIVVEVIVQLLAYALDHVFHLPVLRQINALLGGLLGLLKGGAVLLMVLAFVQLFLPTEKLLKSDPVLSSLNRSPELRYVLSHNPVNTLLKADIWNEVGIHENEKQKL